MLSVGPVPTVPLPVSTVKVIAPCIEDATRTEPATSHTKESIVFFIIVSSSKSRTTGTTPTAHLPCLSLSAAFLTVLHTSYSNPTDCQKLFQGKTTERRRVELRGYAQTKSITHPQEVMREWPLKTVDRLRMKAAYRSCLRTPCFPVEVGRYAGPSAGAATAAILKSFLSQAMNRLLHWYTLQAGVLSPPSAA